MSFWVGVVIIVLILEAVRIGLSSFLLLHILRGLESPEERGAERPSAGWARERDRLASEAMNAVRVTMDGLPEGDNQMPVRRAIRALDAYVLHHQDRTAD